MLFLHNKDHALLDFRWSLKGPCTYDVRTRWGGGRGRPVVLLHVILPGLGRGRVEYLSIAQIFYSLSAKPMQRDMQENDRSGRGVPKKKMKLDKGGRGFGQFGCHIFGMK